MSASENAAPSRVSAPSLRRDGRALLWASLLVFAIANVASLAVPDWQQSLRETRARATVAELRRFADIFQNYAHSHGNWPATAAPGIAPAGLEDALKSGPWEQPTPIGGHYVWLVDTRQRGQRLHAAIGIVGVPGNPVSSEARQLSELLDKAKDAHLPPNRLRLGFQHEPIYVLEN